MWRANTGVASAAWAIVAALVLSGLPSGPAHAQSLAAAVLPTSRSVQVGAPATAFATIINAGNIPATSCGIALGGNLPAVLHYQTTNPVTNAPVGTPDTPATILPGQAQTYSFSITATSPLSPTDVRLTFRCANTSPAPVIPGVNTLLLSASATPVPDIVALVATPTNDGVVALDGTGAGVFAVGSVNVGTSGVITVTADTGTASLPVIFALCQTTANSQCAQAPGASVTLQVDANQTPAFGVFVFAANGFATDPAVNRAFVRFRDRAGVTRGSSSVAIKTPAATTLAGTWRLTASGVARADNGATEAFTLDLPPFAVAQTGNALSGTVVAGDAEDLIGILPSSCSLSCAAPGSCSLTCPGLACAIACNPATPLCGERLALTGTIAGSALDFALQSNPSVSATCSGVASGTLFINETNLYTGTGTALFGAQPAASGTFAGRTNQTCGGTGDFAGAIECVGFSTSGTFDLSVSPKLGPSAAGAAAPRPTALEALTRAAVRGLGF